jgi:hypothetical protein
VTEDVISAPTGFTGLLIACLVLAESAWAGAPGGSHAGSDGPWLFQTVNATRFSGTSGVEMDGDPATVGKGYSNLLTVAPALEYLWNQHVGLIAGPWMSLRGRNTSEFFGAVVALYLYL